jgi:hypothetical protein
MGGARCPRARARMSYRLMVGTTEGTVTDHFENPREYGSMMCYYNRP